MSTSSSRPHAAEFCITNSWGPGTVLVSSSWKTPRKIHGPVRKSDTHVCVMIMDDQGRHMREDYLKTMPPDVKCQN